MLFGSGEGTSARVFDVLPPLALGENLLELLVVGRR
jgi:hypothetical protein